VIADAVSSGGSVGEYVVTPSGDGDSWQVDAVVVVCGSGGGEGGGA
jgi:hypothetical protein